jgi:rfaE bifunctional protein nucleotidyltransferase chain/domain
MAGRTKLLTLKAAIARRRRLAAAGRQVVLTNGVFDLLHPGHQHYLQRARRLGEALIVALNSNASTRLLKGPTRPVQGQGERARALSALPYVDGVVIFRGKRLDREIRALRPDVYCKAGDYTLAKLDPAERAALEAVGARITFMPFLAGHSTTKKIEALRAAGRP